MAFDDELSAYESYFKSVKNELEVLKTDLELVEDGWTLHFAIDFAELFAFAFPLTQTPHLVPQPKERGAETFTREQAALAFLFAKWKEQILTLVQSLILLPPYQEELGKALGAFQLRRFEAYSWTGILRELHKRAFGESYAKIRDLVAKYIEEERVPESIEDRAAIASYIEKEYPDVVSLLATTDSRAGLSVLKAILGTGIITSVKKHFVERYPLQPSKALELKDVLDDDIIKQNSKKWLTKLDKLRPGRPAANLVDASACAMIRAINEKLSEHKAVLLIISHSRSVKQALEDRDAEDTMLAKEAYGCTKSGSGIRDLDYLWYYYIHKEDNREHTMQRVRATICLLDQFTELQAKLGNNWKIRRPLLHEAESVLEKCGNLSLGATTIVPLIEWLEETRRGVPLWSGSSARLGNAVLRMIRDANMAEELIIRRDEEQSNFESLIQDYTINL